MAGTCICYNICAAVRISFAYHPARTIIESGSQCLVCFDGPCEVHGRVLLRPNEGQDEGKDKNERHMILCDGNCDVVLIVIRTVTQRPLRWQMMMALSRDAAGQGDVVERVVTKYDIVQG
jgi:hypothetical protein